MNEEKLIPGIYNYCDRWCEHCNYTDRCRLFQTEAERNIKHILNDEDPNDPKVFASDITENLMNAVEMLREKFEELNIDPEEVEDAELFPAPDFNSYAINNLAESFTNNLFPLLESLYEEQKLLSNDDENNDFQSDKQKEIKVSLSVLEWYAPQVYVKTKRLLQSREEYLAQDDEELKDLDKEDFYVTAKLLLLATENCISSIHKLQQYFTSHSDELSDLIIQLHSIKKELIILVPDVTEYKRPYFD